MTYSGQTFATPEEALEHFGIKGMKWGVRKERARTLKPLVQGDITRKLSNGDELTLSAHPPNKINKALAAISENYTKSYSQGAHLTIKDKDGKKIGDASFWKKNDTELYLNWVGIKGRARGKGYATEVLKAAAEHGKAMGMKRMILEVPGNSPDARHIYEKMGFKPTGKTLGHKGDIWGGLTEMEYKFDEH